MDNNKKIYAWVLTSLVIGIVLGFLITKFVNKNIPLNNQPGGAAGDVSNTARIAQIGMNVGTSTICAIQNNDARDRVITKVYTLVMNAQDTGAPTGGNTILDTGPLLSVATSSNQYATTSATLTNYFVKDVAWSTSTPSYYASSTLKGNNANTSINSMIWKASSWLLFRFASSTELATTTASGVCGAEYYPF